MKTCTGWDYHPYSPLMRPVGDPVITRLVPGEDSIHVEWLPAAENAEYTVRIGLRGGELAAAGTTRACEMTVSGLPGNTDHRIVVTYAGGESLERLFRTGACPGTVVNYLHPDDRAYAFSGQYLCSPSLVRLPGGALLASMDVFGHNTPQNLTKIFRSDDDGRTWHFVSDLFPCFWGKMFVQNGILYMLACSTEYGDLLIGASHDKGRTFGAPTVLLRGSGRIDVPGVHKNPQPVVRYGGRIWNTLEWGCWHDGTHSAMVMSAPEDADLTDPAVWRLTPPVPYDPAWPGTAEGPSGGNIEGCLTVAPDGNLYNIMRYDMTRCTPDYGRILAYRVRTDDPDAPLEYSHAIFFPANHSKFEIQRDEETGLYISIATRILDSANKGSRNLLSLMASRDLVNWTVVTDLIDSRDEDPRYTGYQYVDFMTEGEDILYLCRTAVNRPHTFHDSNYSTFHRIRGFRKLLKEAGL